MPFGYNWKYCFFHPWEFPIGFYYNLKAFVQKLFRGYSDRDLWSLDYTIIKFTLPRLRAFRKNLHGHPFCVLSEFREKVDELPKDEFDFPLPEYMMSQEKWEQILDEMVEGFQIIVDEQDFGIGLPEDPTQKKIDLALKHFHDWFTSLWI